MGGSLPTARPQHSALKDPAVPNIVATNRLTMFVVEDEAIFDLIDTLAAVVQNPVGPFGSCAEALS